jgi:outer membrane biosynthesis protein TonB
MVKDLRHKPPSIGHGHGRDGGYRLGEHAMFAEMWTPMILSALIHGMIFGGLFVFGSYLSSARVPLLPAQMVQLVDIPGGGPGGIPQAPVKPQPPVKVPEPAPSPPKAEKPPEPKALEPSAEKPPPPAKPKAPEPEMTVPVPKAPQPVKKEPPKREEKKPEHPERPVTEKRQETPPVQRPPAEATRRPETPPKPEAERPGSGGRPGPATGSGPGSGLALGSGSGMLSLDTANFPYSYYLRQVTGRIEENWMRPQGDLGRVVVYFRIKRDGSIVEPQIHESSRSKSVDLLAAGAIKRSEPFPPLPIEFGGDYLGTYLCFGVGSACPGQRGG